MRQTWSGVLVVAVGSMMALGHIACGSDEEPAVRILTPPAGSTHTLGTDDKKIALAISAKDFSLKAPGTCGTDQRCGQAYLNIDGDLCNLPGKPYNAVLGDGTLGQDFFLEADFSYCPPTQQMGMHNVTVSLHRDDGTLVMGVGNIPVAATISLVTTLQAPSTTAQVTP